MHTSDVTNTRAQTHTHKIHVTIRYTRHISFRCKGTLAYVHLSCLERWLNQSCRTYCELCRYYFNAVETPRYRWWALYLSGMNTSESAVSQAGCNSSTECTSISRARRRVSYFVFHHRTHYSPFRDELFGHFFFYFLPRNLFSCCEPIRLQFGVNLNLKDDVSSNRSRNRDKVRRFMH